MIAVARATMLPKFQQHSRTISRSRSRGQSFVLPSSSPPEGWAPVGAQGGKVGLVAQGKNEAVQVLGMKRVSKVERRFGRKNHNHLDRKEHKNDNRNDVGSRYKITTSTTTVSSHPPVPRTIATILRNFCRRLCCLSIAR